MACVALEVLSQVPEKGDERAIAIACARLEGAQSLPSRCAALEALIQVAEKGDQRAIAGACASLERYTHSAVGRRVLEALSQVAEKGDERTIAIACARLKDAALEALSQVAEEGDVRAIAGVYASLDRYTHSAVRCAALEELSQVAQKGDGCLTAYVFAFLEDADSKVRCAALQALSQVAGKGDAYAIACACVLLEDANCKVRCAALEVLSQVAEKGDERAIAGVCARLEDADSKVRCAALQALSQVAGKGDERTISGACASLEDVDWEVRCAALEALSQVAEKGDARAIAGACARLEDANCKVGCAALEALSQVAEKGDQRAIAGACARLEDADSKVRCAALEALSQVAEKGDERAIAGACARLEDADPRIRIEALRVLSKVAKKGDMRALSGIHARLRDADQGVRRAASEVRADMTEEDGVNIASTRVGKGNALHIISSGTDRRHVSCAEWRTIQLKGMAGRLGGCHSVLLVGLSATSGEYDYAIEKCWSGRDDQGFEFPNGVHLSFAADVESNLLSSKIVQTVRGFHIRPQTQLSDVYQAAVDTGPYHVTDSNCHHAVMAAFKRCLDKGVIERLMPRMPNELHVVATRVFQAGGINLFRSHTASADLRSTSGPQGFVLECVSEEPEWVSVNPVDDVEQLRQEKETLRVQLMTTPLIDEPPQGVDALVAQMVLDDLWQYSISGSEQFRPGHIVAIGPADELMNQGTVRGLNFWDRQPRCQLFDPVARSSFKKMMIQDGMQIVEGRDGSLVANDFFANRISTSIISGGSGAAAAQGLSAVQGSILFKVSADGGLKEYRHGRLWKEHCGSRQPP